MWIDGVNYFTVRLQFCRKESRKRFQENFTCSSKNTNRSKTTGRVGPTAHFSVPGQKMQVKEVIQKSEEDRMRHTKRTTR